MRRRRPALDRQVRMKLRRQRSCKRRRTAHTKLKAERVRILIREARPARATASGCEAVNR